MWSRRRGWRRSLLLVLLLLLLLLLLRECLTLQDGERLVAFAFDATELPFELRETRNEHLELLHRLVAVTAGADVLSPAAAVCVGAVGGVLSMAATAGLLRLRIDDPVGAVPVHLVSGLWGTLAVGLFVPSVSFAAQLLGVTAVAVFCVATSSLLFGCLKATVGLRVSADHEVEGLDVVGALA